VVGFCTFSLESGSLLRMLKAPRLCSTGGIHCASPSSLSGMHLARGSRHYHLVTIQGTPGDTTAICSAPRRYVAYYCGRQLQLARAGETLPYQPHHDCPLGIHMPKWHCNRGPPQEWQQGARPSSAMPTGVTARLHRRAGHGLPRPSHLGTGPRGVSWTSGPCIMTSVSLPRSWIFRGTSVTSKTFYSSPIPKGSFQHWVEHTEMVLLFTDTSANAWPPVFTS